MNNPAVPSSESPNQIAQYTALRNVTAATADTTVTPANVQNTPSAPQSPSRQASDPNIPKPASTSTAPSIRPGLPPRGSASQRPAPVSTEAIAIVDWGE